MSGDRPQRDAGGGREALARDFVEEHTARVAPLLRASHEAVWEAATTGSAEAVERSARARTEYRHLHADAGSFARVRAWMADDAVRDPLLRRQLLLLAREMTANQLPPETLEELGRREAELEGVFATFRAELGGERVGNNRILDVLATERDEATRRAAWEASKQIGSQVAEGLRELARRRNAAARSLGYADHYRMELELQELGEDRLFAVVDDFASRTEAPFRALRAEMDAALAQRFGMPVDELRPWHWEDPFGQEAPSTSEVDLDAAFRGRDAVPLAAEFFHGIGLPVDDVLARSDLYEREGKDQHAFCIDVDREGDVRILCNLQDNEKWTSTLLHELGHAVYDRFVPASLPFLLRTPAHILATESVAMYMGRLTRDPAWLREVAGADLSVDDADAVRRQLRAAMLVSTRWMLVMIHFERALYRDPDRADLNALWWDLVERFQHVRRPDGRDEPDWAAKPHFAIAPVYYHNYLLGELMASQISAASRRRVPEGRSVAGQESVGRFLRERIFAPGASVHWNEILVGATGEALTARSFVEEFVGA